MRNDPCSYSSLMTSDIIHIIHLNANRRQRRRLCLAIIPEIFLKPRAVVERSFRYFIQKAIDTSGWFLSHHIHHYPSSASMGIRNKGTRYILRLCVESLNHPKPGALCTYSSNIFVSTAHEGCLSRVSELDTHEEAEVDYTRYHASLV